MTDAALDPATLRYAVRVIQRRIATMERERKAIRSGSHGQNDGADFQVSRLIGEMRGLNIAIGLLNRRATRIENVAARPAKRAKGTP